jgi:hypothetical protein
MKTCFWKKKYAENLQIVEEFEDKVGIKMHSSLKIYKYSQRQFRPLGNTGHNLAAHSGTGRSPIQFLYFFFFFISVGELNDRK